LLSGSGATVFGIFQEEAGARRAAAYFHERSDLKIFVTKTSSEPLRVE
jgi:4-diphosphocytidyl-2-C-methyl-D-erythritol kinase